MAIRGARQTRRDIQTNQRSSQASARRSNFFEDARHRVAGLKGTVSNALAEAKEATRAGAAEEAEHGAPRPGGGH